MALGGHEGVIALFEVGRGRRHAEILAPAIDFVCAQADIGLDELGLVAVDVGPGLFTGMRVGLATGKALALALRVPMIGISSLDLLAFPHRRSDRVVVPVDRRPQGRGVLRHVPPGARRAAAGRRAAGRPGRRARRRPARPQPGGAVRRRRRAALPRRDPRRLPLRDRRRGAPVGRPARAAGPRPGAARGVGQPGEIRPVYLRQPDAQINWATRGPAKGAVRRERAGPVPRCAPTPAG